MATGVHGAVGLLVQLPAMEALSLAPGFVTIHHLQMEEQHAREQALRVPPATQRLVEQANI